MRQLNHNWCFSYPARPWLQQLKRKLSKKDRQRIQSKKKKKALVRRQMKDGRERVWGTQTNLRKLILNSCILKPCKSRTLK